MWKNVVVEMSYWGHSRGDYCDRDKNFEGLEEKQQEDDVQKWVRSGYLKLFISNAAHFQLREQFQLNFKVPVIFIDPVVEVCYSIFSTGGA